jgi:hypothetical protein
VQRPPEAWRSSPIFFVFFLNFVLTFCLAYYRTYAELLTYLVVGHVQSDVVSHTGQPGNPIDYIPDPG